ncbi:SPP1 gp7 family putative phage head morphogenesis protein [Williamsia limnetica]|uniref:SPP1 gp7 family putative phage head morphogenesis protein n=1 Tax=Williamsia limnetica TaxID=882452 RepID=A0A318RHJ0_WILLI|nr:minor capsid protein [Williamsia limnetica]PYE14058.1 SPP1 gp7 family putative phage head morphogenesis protein [Williamsia limnetica]
MLESLRRQFEVQRTIVLGKLDTTPTPTKGYTRKDWLSDVVDWGDLDKEMARVLAPLLLGIVAETGKCAFEQVNLDPSLFNTFNQAIQTYYQLRSSRIAKDVNDETEKQLRAELSQGIQAGETSFELRARVEKVFGAALIYRADRIARTEVTRAQSFADIEGWTQSGVVEGKEWFTAQDERVCKFCRPLNGKVVPLTKNFFSNGDVFEGDGGKTINLDYDDVPGAPLHGNCRCVLLPVLVE